MASNKVKTAKTTAKTAAGKGAAAKVAPKALVKTDTAAPAKRGRKKAVERDLDHDEMELGAERELDPVDASHDEGDGLDDSDLDSGLGGDDDEELGAQNGEAAWLVGSAAATSEEKRRKAVVPPSEAPEGMTLFDYLSRCNPPLDKKIIDIAIAQTKVPQELGKDAAQEIRLVWSNMKPDLKRFKPGQIASYAHRMAKHTALRVRRDLGSSVRLPGSAFRKRRDGSSYVTPGVLSVALDWNELEGWMDMDDAVSEAFGTSGISGMGDEELLSELGGMVETYSAEDDEEEILKQRVKVLESFKDKLTERQFQILMRLSRGDTYEEVQKALQIKKGVMNRDLQLAACVIGPL